jgi:hypothetical protein
MVQFSKATLGEAPQDINPYRQARLAQEFKPSTGQVVSSFVDEAFSGEQSLEFDIKRLAVTKAEETGQPFTEEEYKKSNYFNPNLSYYNGMTKEAALLLSDNQTQVDRRAFVISKASGMQSVAGFTSALAAGTFEPKNAAIGVATSMFGGAFINRAIGAKKLFSIYQKYGKYPVMAAKGGVEGLVAAAIAEPSNRESAKVLRQDYTMADSMFNIATSSLFSAAFNVVPETFKDVQAKRVKLRNEPISNAISTLAEASGIDPATMISIAGVESSYNPNAVNKDTGAFGLYQFTPETAKQYGITADSSMEEQISAGIKFTQDNIKVLQSNLGREVNPLDVYMAHWLGAEGASKVLTSSPDKLAVDVFKENGFYKGYEKKVLTQNGLDENATVADLIVTRTRMMTKALGKAIDAPLPDVLKGKSKDLITEELDTAASQLIEGRQIDVANVEKIRGGDLFKADIETQAKAAETRFRYTETPEFKTRFEGSKVVDEQGAPLRVYHGTKSQFESFDIRKAGTATDAGMSGEGIYFTPNAKTAEGYGGNIKQGYLAIKKPFVLDEFMTKAEIADKLNISEDILSGNKEQGFHVKQPYSATFTSAVKDKGFDGVISEKRQEVVAFNPDQIIPAFGADDLPAITARLQKENTEAIKASVLKANDPVNSTALDETLVRSFDQETKDLADYKTQDDLADLEAEIASLKDQGLLDDESLSALGDLENYKLEDIQAGYEAAYLCLNRG